MPLSINQNYRFLFSNFLQLNYQKKPLFSITSFHKDKIIKLLNEKNYKI